MVGGEGTRSPTTGVWYTTALWWAVTILVLLLAIFATAREPHADNFMPRSGRLGTVWNSEPPTRRYYAANVARDPWSVKNVPGALCYS
jgi:hypothetical protein